MGTVDERTRVLAIVVEVLGIGVVFCWSVPTTARMWWCCSTRPAGWGTGGSRGMWRGSPAALSFVVSLNLQRRHLTSSQKATVAMDVLPMLEAEAQERQRAAGERGNEGGRGNAKTLHQLIDEGFDEPRNPVPQALEQAAQMVDGQRERW